MPSGRTQGRIVCGLMLIAALVWALTAPAFAEDHDGDFTVVRALTVHFADGKYDVSRSQRSQLQQLAAQAQGIEGYMISVAASAPAAGSDPADQKLSMQRASAITVVLRLAGVPVANLIVVPATTGAGQAAYRSAVVTLLQNKASSGQ